MKPNFIFKMLLLVCFAGSLNVSFAQAIHPLHFGTHALPDGTSTSTTNWYLNYVGSRVTVTTPSIVAGDKVFTIANDGISTTGQWGAPITTPIVNVQAVMCTTDTQGCLIPPGSMTGKIALIWRGGCDFTCKAEQASNAGAVAIVILNQHPGEGPVGMGLSTTCTTAPLIPVIMLGNSDGLAIDAAYHSTPPVKMTITPWGQNYLNDLGFVPNGVASWHAFAVPANQFSTDLSAYAYKGNDVAFVANFGSHPATNVKVHSSLYFTPSSSTTPTFQHADSVTFAGPFVGVYSVPADTTRDSIMAMVAGSDYTLSATGTGRFDLTYNISSDSVDQSLADNTFTTSFYLSDSVFSKGRYDFTNQRVLRNTYAAFPGLGNEFVWGPMYYVAKDSQYLSKVQYSIHANSTPGTTYFLPASNDILIFKWLDGSNGHPRDSIVQDGELELDAIGTKNFNTTTDSSEADLSLSVSGSNFVDPTGAALPNFMLSGGNWYYVAVDFTNNSSSNPEYLGIDGQLNPLPRIYGRSKVNSGYLDYSSVEMTSRTDTGFASAPIPATQTSFVNDIDSFLFASAKGLIPAVAMVMRGTPDTSTSHVGVNTVQAAHNIVDLFPNPAANQMNVEVQLAQQAATVTYRIIDGLGRFVSKETHYNVQNETFSLNTSSLAAGNYYLIIATDGKSVLAKKFTVAR